MSIRIRNAAAIQPGASSTAGMGAGAATVAFRLRFNWPPATGENSTYVSGNNVAMYSSNIDPGAEIVNFIVNWNLSVGSPGTTVQLKPSINNFVAMTYDAADPNKQAIYVNESVTLLTPAGSAAFKGSNSTQVNIGNFTSTVSHQIDFSIEDVLHIDGYALTQAEVNAFRDGADPTTYGPGAALRGYWSFKGTPGTTPAVGDAALANFFDGTQTPTLFVGTTAGSSLVYDQALPYIAPLDHGDWSVYSSGRFVRCGVNLQTTGEPVKINAGGAVTAPTITIDGGAPVALVNPYYSADCAGVLYQMPAGQTIPKGSAVAVTTQTGWLQTASGLVLPATNLVIPNRSGNAVYGDDPPTMRVGFNMGVSVTDWSVPHSIKNKATRGQVTTDTVLRADRTVMNNFTQFFVLTSYDNAFDRTLTPKELGLYALQYDDNDPVNNPTTIDIVADTGYGQAFVTRLHEYDNPGVNGIGKGSVYQVSRCGGWPISLAAAVAPTDTVLTLASNADVADAVSYGHGPVQWFMLGSEYIDITALGPGANQITVNRGVYGTTAGSYTSGTTATMEAYLQWPNLKINYYNATTGQPNYKNLVIYGPSDWTPPATPGPIELDRSFATTNDVSNYYKAALVPGIGVIRQMDSTEGGYDQGCEPEHMRQDDDPFPAGHWEFQVDAEPISSEPATATNAPYMYTYFQVQNAVKYPVALAAAITTAPAAGTVETITITNDPANPLMYATRIELTGGEVVRVLSVNGNNVSVVRGAEGTAPAVCSAGTMQARWRVPVASDAVWQQPKAATTLYRTATPHGLWNDVLVGFPTSNDLNPLARFNVTLTAAVDAATTTFPVSVATGDAQYLTYGLYVVFDSECVFVDSYDSTAGTISVVRNAMSSGPGRLTADPNRVGAAAAHASGVVGTASSGGVFCKSADGTLSQWSNQASYGTCVIVTGPDSFVVQQSIYNSTQVWNQVGTQTFSPVLAGTSSAVQTAGPGDVYSYDFATRVVKHAPGADMWLNISNTASDDTVRKIAQVVRDGLPAGEHRILMEMGNEIWNGGSPRLYAAQRVADVCGYASAIDVLIVRGLQIVDVLKSVFAEQGRQDEIKFVLAWQQGSLQSVIDRAVALGVNGRVDVYSTAPYFSPAQSTMINNAYAAATNEEALDIWLFELEYNLAGTAGTSYIDGQAVANERKSSGRAIDFIHYEGGPDSFVPGPYGGKVVNGGDVNKFTRNMDMNYNPNTYFARYDFAHVCRRRGGSTGIAFYKHTGNPAYTAVNGVNTGDYESLWLLNEWHGQPAGRGDGSDGKADNRLVLAQAGQTHTKSPVVNQAENVVSVSQQAVLDYAAAYAAYNAGGGPTNPPPDVVPGKPKWFVPSYHQRRRRMRSR